MRNSASWVRIIGLVCVAALATMFLGPATLASSNSTTEVDMANDQCNVYSSPTTCQGGYTATQTFRSALVSGEIVSVTVAYLYGNSMAATFGFSDSLGNSIVLATSQCSVSTPIVCTAVGYFYVTQPGNDDIFFTETGGNTGELWYNAEIWQGQFTSNVVGSGSSSSCPSSCSGQLSLGPLSAVSHSAIGLNIYVGYYPHTPATWQPSYTYSYSLTDYNSQGGDSILWQGTTSHIQQYVFGAGTSPTPLVWAGSAEVISWI